MQYEFGWFAKKNGEKLSFRGQNSQKFNFGPFFNFLAFLRHFFGPLRVPDPCMPASLDLSGWGEARDSKNFFSLSLHSSAKFVGVGQNFAIFSM